MTLGDRIVCMKDGRIQQSDTPLVTYHRPANRYVAGFIGMPPMNFFDGALSQKDGRLYFTEGQVGGSASGLEGANGELTLPDGGFTIALPDRLRELLAGSIGSHVVLGVRPEDLSFQPRTPDTAKLSLHLKVVEPLGREMDVYMASNQRDGIVARVEAHSGLQMDTMVDVFIDLRKIHVFEPGSTGRNMSLATEHAHAFA